MGTHRHIRYRWLGIRQSNTRESLREVQELCTCTAADKQNRPVDGYSSSLMPMLSTRTDGTVCSLARSK